MNRKQLQVLISAGVFSAALLSGAAYAEESKTTDKDAAGATAVQAPAPDDGTQAQTAPKTDTSGQDGSDASKSAAKQKTSGQAPASSGCAGAGGCGH